MFPVFACKDSFLLFQLIFPSLTLCCQRLSMDQIQHNYVESNNGVKIHLAEIGAGETVVLFLHGFPEIWYSWRHQMIAAAKAGYRAIAPDFRGYGLSDASPEPDKTTFKDTVADLLAILDSLTIPKVFLVAKDWGTRPAYLLAFLHPTRVSGIITLGVPYMPPSPEERKRLLPEGFYISRWREPGRAEADFSRFDAKTVVKNVYILFSKSEIPIADENQEIMDLVEPSTPLPSWFSDEDLKAYGDLYENSGLQTALQVPYRSIGEVINLPNSTVDCPALLIMGEEDYFIKFPGVEDYVRSGNAKFFVPKLETIYVPQGSHFVQEQFPDKVNELILAFLSSQAIATTE
ncbi:AB hydrolase superfamily protein YfhM-like [Impatiens glandulifera]|uniref:AB hydrolase superfamily protein YfhM-like n=1 Tax=Impatiens glandulifera TaxID=253017 RepID=UPI001FB0AF98|nr:AB hydrolase superfamily protein YfhM-like [Impatiens glandulifera]